MGDLIKRQTLTSQVIDYILGLVKGGHVKPGEKLPTEMELTSMLGVSRTCVREAVKSLESLRLVSVRPKIGTVVLEPSPAAMLTAEHLSTLETDTLMEFRNILEVGLAPLAAEKATRRDLDAMKQAIDAHKRGLETDGIVYDADIAFHKAIAEASKNNIAMAVLELISGPLFEQRRMTNAFPESARKGLREHIGLFKAIRDHKPDLARTLMRAHMRTAGHYWQLAKASRNGAAKAGGSAANGDRKV